MAKPVVKNAPELVSEAELLRLRELEQAYTQLKLEHDLLKKPFNSLPLQNERFPFHGPKFPAFPDQITGKITRLCRAPYLCVRPIAAVT